MSDDVLVHASAFIDGDQRFGKLFIVAAFQSTGVLGFGVLFPPVFGLGPDDRLAMCGQNGHACLFRGDRGLKGQGGFVRRQREGLPVCTLEIKGIDAVNRLGL